MDLSSGVKRQRRESDHSSPTSAEVKNGGVVPPFPPVSSWHDTYLIKRDNFNFSFIITIVQII
jgi:hypothetical protein